MGSTFTGIEIAKRSLFAQQAALQTTGHNISNANTTGYTRQVVNLTAARPMEAVGLTKSNAAGQMGMGVEVDSVNRIREQFLDNQYYNQSKDYGSWSVQNDILSKLEAITNEPSDTGISTVIQNFWNSWQSVSREPDNTTARAALKENALAMTDAFNHTAQQLTDLNSSITDDIDVKAVQANTMLGQIADLNGKIQLVKGVGDNPNDLMDQRDELVDQLSQIVNITVQNVDNGKYSISMGNTNLVSGSTVTTSFATSTGTPPAGNTVNLSDAYKSGDLKSGEIYGMLYSQNNYMASYQFQLDSMVKTLAQGDVTITLPQGTVLPSKLPAGTVINGTTYNGTETLSDSQRVITSAGGQAITVKGLNGVHELGYTLGSPPASGIPFFSIKPGATDFTAASFTVNPDIVADTSKISSSARVQVDASNNIVKDANGNEIPINGNNDIALQMVNLQNAKVNFDTSSTEGVPVLKDGTFDEFYRALVGQLGVQAQEATRQSNNQKALVDQVDGQRQSVSGVSMDEEMANMIKFQHAYNAAARVLTTFDEDLDKIINSMGLVGR